MLGTGIWQSEVVSGGDRRHFCMPVNAKRRKRLNFFFTLFCHKKKKKKKLTSSEGSFVSTSATVNGKLRVLSR